MVLMTKSHFTQVPSMSSPQPLQEIGQAAGEGDAVALYTIKWSDSTEGIRVRSTASLSHLRTMLPKSISCPKPAQQPNHAT